MNADGTNETAPSVENAAPYVQRVFDLLPFGVAVWHAPTADPGDCRLLAANEGASVMAVDDIRDHIGESMREAYPLALEGEPGTRGPDLLVLCADSGEINTAEVHYPGDQPAWYAFHHVPLGDRVVALVFEDTTARKEAQLGLERLNAELEERVAARTAELEASQHALRRRAEALARSNADLQDFANIVSHDLQAPLRRIKSFGERLADSVGESLGEEESTYLTRLLHSAERGQTLVLDLLSYARIAREDPAETTVSLDETLSHVQSDLEHEIHASGAIIDVQPLPSLEADPTHMRQLFQNLLENALKFVSEGTTPRVGVTGRVDGPDVVVCVSDNGIGFDPGEAASIFGPFQRLHAYDEYEGSGIGLAICHRICRHYGGTIEATSSGRGATFTVRLPVEQAGQDGDKAAVEAQPW